MDKKDILSKIVDTYNGEFPAVLVLNNIDAYDVFGIVKPLSFKGFKVISSEFIDKDSIWVTDDNNWNRMINNFKL